MSGALRIGLAVTASLIAAAGLAAVSSAGVTSFVTLSPATMVAAIVSILVLVAAAWLATSTPESAGVGVIVTLLAIAWSVPPIAGWAGAPIVVRMGARFVAPFTVPLLVHLISASRRSPTWAGGRGMLAALYGVTTGLSTFVLFTRNPFYDARCWSDCLVPPVLPSAPIWMTALGANAELGVCVAGLLLGVIQVARPARDVGGRPAIVMRCGALLALASLTAIALAVRAVPVSAAGWPVLVSALFCTTAVAVSATAAAVIADAAESRLRLARVERLGAQLARMPEDWSAQAALSDLFGDGSIVPAFPLGDDGQLIDADGRPSRLEPSPGRRRLEIRRAGSPIAFADVTSSSSSVDTLTDQLGAAARVAIDNERLSAEILAHLDELRRSRARIVAAADESRRRTERDLHDGAQSHLVGLLYSVAAAVRTRVEGWPDADIQLLEELAATLREHVSALREIAHGVFPADLDSTGLEEAIRTLMDRAQIPTELTIELDDRPPPAVEHLTYIVVKTILAGQTQPVEFDIAGSRESLRLRCRGAGIPSISLEQSLLVDRVSTVAGTIRFDADDIVMEVPCGVALVDDSLLIRQGLVSLLAAEGIEVTASVATPDALRSAIRIDPPDAAIVDIRMPPTFTDEGLIAAADIRAEFPGMGVLILSHHIEPSYAMRLIADYPERTGYLLKERLTDGAILRDSLERIAAGETVIDPTIVARLMSRRRTTDPLDVLTEREAEVLRLVAEGLSNQAIAERLWITDRTVESHVSKVFAKLRIDDDAVSHRRVLAVLAYLRGTGGER